MKLTERVEEDKFASYSGTGNLGYMDADQQKNISSPEEIEQEVDGDVIEDDDVSEGSESLCRLLGALISGTISPEEALREVQNSEKIDDNMKQIIVSSSEEGKQSLAPIENTGMGHQMSEGKRRLIRDFQRYI